MRKVAPLNSSFMIGSLLGMLFSALYVFNKSKSFGLAFFIVFFVMFVASVISLYRASPDALLYVDQKAMNDDLLYEEIMEKRVNKK